MDIACYSARAIQSEQHRIGAYSHGKKGDGSWTGLQGGKWQWEQVPILRLIVSGC